MVSIIPYFIRIRNALILQMHIANARFALLKRLIQFRLFFCSFVSMSLCVERLIHLRFVAILSFNSIQCNDFPNGIRMNRLTEWPKLDDTFEIIHIHKTYRNYADINSLKG